MNEVGKAFQDLSDESLRQIKGATVKKNQRIGTGEGAEIDHIVSHGRIKVYIESKYSIRTIRRRTVKQIKNAYRKAKRGDAIILNVARKPTPKEKKALRKAITPAVYGRLKIKSSQTSLYKEVLATFKGKKP